LKVDLGEITLDLAAAGYGMVLKDHQLKAMKYLWSLDGDGASSREVCMADITGGHIDDMEPRTGSP
jgi:hypothetical protein